MKKKFMTDILEILKDKNIEEILKENNGIRRDYSNYIMQNDINFSVKTIKYNNYQEMKNVYILKQKNFNLEKLKEEEIKFIKKFIVYSKLKNLDNSTLEKLKDVNNIIKMKNLDTEINKNAESRQEILNFIKNYEESFYNNYIKENGELKTTEKQLNLIKAYDDFLKNEEKLNGGI